MQVERAIVELAAMPSTRLVRRSRLFRTPPWGLSQQPEFVNAVAEVETGLAPIELRARLDGLIVARHFPGLVKAGDCAAVVAVPL